MTALSLPNKRLNVILFTMLAIFPLLGMGIDLLSPALPSMRSDLGVATSSMKSLIAAYLSGYAVGGLCIGLFTDCFGRRRLLLTMLGLAVLASFASVLTHHIVLLLMLRLVQGITFGVSGIVARSVFSDILPMKRLMHLMPVNAALWGIGPVIGPVIGGYLQFYLGWQACYVFFAVYALLVWIGTYLFLPETLLNPLPFRVEQIKTNVVSILRSYHFIGIGLSMGLAYSAVVGFNILAPFLLQDVFHQSAITYGHIALSMGLVFLVGTFLCRALLKRDILPEKIMQWTLVAMLIVCLVGLLILHFCPMSLTVLLLVSYLIFMGCALVYPSGLSRCASMFRTIAGTNAAVMITLSLTTTTLSSSVLSFIHASTPSIVLFSYLGFVILALLLRCCLLRTIPTL